MIVLDASAALEVLLRTPNGQDIQNRIFAQGESLHAPHLIDLEVAAVLRRYVIAGDMDVDRAGEALIDFADFPMQRYPHHPFVQRTWALRHNITVYDAVYVALAEALKAVLVTADGRLARSSGHDASVEIFAG